MHSVPMHVLEGLHEGQKFVCTLPRGIDNNTVADLRHEVENAYRDLFHKELGIETMRRDRQTGELTMVLARKNLDLSASFAD